MKQFPFIAALTLLGIVQVTGQTSRVQLGLQSGSQVPQHSEPADRQVANYRIEVRLHPELKTVAGHEVLTWSNRGRRDVKEFRFHLYLNAFKNNRSTFMRENSYRLPWASDGHVPDDYWGHIKVESIQILTNGSEPARRIVESGYVQPDDGNPWDQTVLRVVVDEPLPAGETIQFRIEFVSKLPRAARRTGWRKDYFFVGQWFPKIGVFADGEWNCHQYHWVSEYFADFGVYDVLLTIPDRFVVGATGRRVARQDNGDGTVTYHYHQDDVHDFAWTASPRFLEKERVFSDPELPSVQIRLLLLPEHAHLEHRYFRAVEQSLRYFGRWFGAYPYRHLTVVDPAYRSGTGGMEYPTLITGRAHFLRPQSVLSPESVTVHEVGHQWWYGLVANNEAEESWLDEGFTSWAESRLLDSAYGPRRFMKSFFGIPFAFDSVRIAHQTAVLGSLRRRGSDDVMARHSWAYLDRGSYLVNSYYKPEIVMWTLERWIGEELMLEVMRTYFNRFRFKHPTTRDFIDTVNEVTQQDMDWFFEQTFFASELVDYGIERATSKLLPDRIGVFEDEEEKSSTDRYRTEVVVRRLQGAKFPVEVLLVFENGKQIRRQWDGQDRWKRLLVEDPSRLRYAVVDPDRRLLLDIDPINNSRYVEIPGGPSWTTLKWASRWLFWLQNVLESFAFVG